jgi:hypothetical protein
MAARPTFIKCSRAGTDNDRLIFEVSADDGRAFQFAMTTDCFMRLFVMGWKAAESLPEAPRQGEAPGLQNTTASFAIVNMQPGLVLLSGPLVLSILLDRQQVEYLRAKIDQLLSETEQGPKH